MRRESIASLAVLTFVAVYRIAPGASDAGPEPQPPAGASADIVYPGCDSVRAAGRAPLYAGQPGYREDMDGDGDGIACEPHRHRL